MTALKLVVAAICVAIFVVRLRDLRRLKFNTPPVQRASKRTLTLVSLLFAIAVLLDVDPFVDWLDALLGGIQLPNLILRAVAYTLFFLIALVTARGFGSLLSIWLVKGIPGRVALIVASGLTITAFFFKDHNAPYAKRSQTGSIALTWQAYLAYLCIALLTCLLPAALSPGGAPVLRTSAALIGLGCIAAISFLPVRAGEAALNYTHVVSNLLKMGTVLLLSAGILTPWVVRRTELMRERRKRGR
ncbi:hypothetical protein [Leifsonia xyli]|uniref:hypothetical protein n=1 Tax=Leifsonia xyli TaxID=1575 RepID=UPI001186F9CC|nr:hypothetical protein [Leifsonia xyli]